MMHAKFFSIVVMVLVLCYGAVGYYFLPMASFQGDLTRMGMLPESEFGWRKPQPSLDLKWLEQSSMHEADVLVIGDSFSEGRIWQTVLTSNGYKVRTEHWDSMRAICTDFMSWLKQQGFHGKFVVLQIIERNIEDGLAKSVACKTTQTHPNVSADQPGHLPPTSFNPDRTIRNGRFSIGIQTWLNYSHYSQQSNAEDFTAALLPNGAKVVRVKNGCDLFSHNRCNDTLVLAEDKKRDIDSKALEMIAQINARMEGVTPIWAFVPNKTTTYIHSNKQFWNHAETLFGAPNLLRKMQEGIERKTVDLYPANNTHFSTTGYLMMGEEIFKAIETSKP